MGNFYQAVSSNKAVSGLLLDVYANFSVAYSLRKLRTLYTGDCIEVYNGTSYASIGFDSSNGLDLTALANHCGSNDGFVSKWYDQSINNNTAFQTDTTKMPKVYDGTTQSVLLQDSKPVIKYIHGNGCSMDITNLVTDSTAHFFNRTGIDTQNDKKQVWEPRFNNSLYSTFLSNGGTALSGTSLFINGVSSTATLKNTFYNAIQPFSGYNSIQNLQSSNITADVLGGFNMHHMQEVIIFNVDMSSERVDVERRINNFYFPPAPATPAQVNSLASWSDPADAAVNDITIPDKTYNNYGPYSAYDNYVGGSNGAAVVDLNGTKCMYLDGVNDRVYTYNIRINSVNIWQPTGDVETFTHELWVRSNGSWLTNGNFINYGYNSAWRCRTNSNSTLWQYFNGTSRSSSSTLATDTWHHLVFSMTGSGTNYQTMNVYRNGSLWQSESLSVNPSYGNAVKFYGGYSSSSESQRMYLGLTRTYEDVALTAAEALQNFNLEKANYGY